MTTETKSRNSARIVKAVSALLMVGGIVASMFAGAVDGPAGAFLFVALVGFLGFVVGRFME
jgi:hypothetical protein